MLFCHIESELAKLPKLRDQKGLQGLPSMAFLDAAGNVLVKIPYDQREVAGLRAAGARAKRYVELRTIAAADHPELGAEFLHLQLEEGQLTHQQAKARRAEVATCKDAPLLAKIDARIVDLEIGEVLREHLAAGATRASLGPRFLEVHRKGPHPSVHVSRGFWFAILECAEAERDPVAFQEGLAGLRAATVAVYPGAQWAVKMLADYEAKLRELQPRKV